MRKIFYFLIFTQIYSINSRLSCQTTYADIAPILYEKCASCHRDGGGAPFSVLDYDEVYSYLGAIYHEVSENSMPPWAPDTNYLHFINERVLSENEKESLLNWVLELGPLGDTTELPPLPVFPPTRLNGTPDLILNTPSFSVNAISQDVYNTVVVPTGITSERYIRAMEIIPENPELTHHIVINADESGVVSNDLSGNSGTLHGDIMVGGYAPGVNPVVFPNSQELKMGIKLPANADLILQIHTPYYTSLGPSYGMDVNIQIRLYFFPEEESNIRDVFSEVPLQYWGNDFFILPNEIKTISTESDPITSNISIFSALPHSHKICTEILNYAYLESDTIRLMKIDNWDFEHQEYYFYKNLVKVPSQYVLHSDHTYENTTTNHHNPFNPPQTITVGLFSNDEMLFDGFQYMIYEPGDEFINIDSILINDPLLNFMYPNSQTLNLFFGWNLISSYINPNKSITELFETISSDIVIIKNGLGQAYLPEWNFNGIGDFNFLEGYLVKVNNDVSLDIIGDFVIPENSPLNLDAGWSIISYLRLDDVSADLIFQDLLSNNNLIIAKNNLGAAYLPEWNFNGIGNLTPGQGYQIKLNQSAELIYFSIFDSY